MTYVNIGEITFKNDIAIFGDPCYWQENGFEEKAIHDMIVDKQYTDIKHSAGHSGAGIIINVGEGNKKVFLEYADEDNYSKYDNIGRPANYVISLNGEEPPEFSEFIDTGIYLDVDAGMTYVGDVSAFYGEKEKDISGEWHTFCNKYFERSGYNEMRDANTKNDNMIMALNTAKTICNIDMPLAIEYANKFVDNKIDENISVEDLVNVIDTTIAKIKNDISDFTTVYKCYAPYYWEDGKNCGFVVDTNYGDGSYPVYVAYDSENKPSHIMVLYTLKVKNMKMNKKLFTMSS
jgi:hypothetical protein